MRVTLGLLLVLVRSSIAAAAPCTAADTTCMENVPLDAGEHLAVYRSQPLTEHSDKIERVFILVHGVKRDGAVYFRTAVDATQDAGELGKTLVIAPQFYAVDGKCADTPASGETVFACTGWSDGDATATAPVSSFAALDRLLQTISNRAVFPSLKEIVVAGHSSGAQFAQRYAATNRIDGQLGVPIRYIVANPSSYLYLDAWRPVDNARAVCPSYNRYKYGLEGLTGYAAAAGVDAIRDNYPRRDVTYLLGELDTTDEHNLDKTCSAMVQGPDRLQRGLAYIARLSQTFKLNHKLFVVPRCDHSASCIYRSAFGRRAVFGP